MIERTKRRWITAAKKAGTWEELVSPAPRKQRSDRGRGRNTSLLTNLCESAQRRVRALYEAQGGATKY